MRRPSNGIIKRVFRFLGVYIVIVFITTFIFSLMQPIISLVGFSILDLLVEIIYSLTGIDMSLHMFSEINASMRNREIKKSLDEQKNILNDINKKMWRYL
ncbi:hypothetical protein EBB54_29010 [Schaedlerella arabinosiphila]|jgi:Trk-type K+ transport system membrane component|uniref:Uncharacterized protein n=1 Tax=Schaedlerella arabinosiphila TaxID=2044587 RepID=A0A3R8JSF9_9FIRM|nr:hypothetical protein EBB54_29010 [Schaedlerella arabinosiphila]